MYKSNYFCFSLDFCVSTLYFHYFQLIASILLAINETREKEQENEDRGFYCKIPKNIFIV